MGNWYNSLNDQLKVVVTLSLLVTIISIRCTSAISIKEGAETTPSNLNNYGSSEEMSVPRRPKIAGDVVENMSHENGKWATSLQCQYEGNPTPQIIWLKNSKSIPPTHEVKTEVKQGKTILEIPENEILVDGKKTNYSCIAANFLGSATKVFIISPLSKKNTPWWSGRK